MVYIGSQVLISSVQFACVAAKVLSSLGLNLNNKAEAYSDPALKSVFMLNNFTYILKALRRY